MIQVDLSDAHNNWDQIIEQVRVKQDRVMLTSQGREIGALIPTEDLKVLESLEDCTDVKAAREILKNSAAQHPFDGVRKKLGL